MRKSNGNLWWEKGAPHPLLGKKFSKEWRENISKANRKYSISRKGRSRLSEIGKLGAKKRWEGHIKTASIKKSYYQSYKEKYPNGATERKRFTNQRYKIRKKNALGSHTFREWLMLKEYYGNMCLCCKRTEPEIKLTEDHIIPLDKGGSDYIENIQPLCLSCNVRKRIKTIDFRPIENTNFLNYGKEGA
jgi:5-methylcytosine-specific restriction endonuclease McrA